LSNQRQIVFFGFKVMRSPCANQINVMEVR
jgi:hypothetical protein